MLNLATLLMFVEWDLNRVAGGARIAHPDHSSLGVLATSLNWLRDNGRSAPVGEIHEYVDDAHRAAVVSIYLLQLPDVGSHVEHASA